MKIKLIFFFALLSFFMFSCKEEDENVIKEPITPTYNPAPFKDMPANDDIIMYEVNLRAFSEEGNLQGVIDRLDEIAALQVNVLWLMPIYPVGIEKGINSPYCIKDFKAVADEYGTLADLRKLTDAAHAKGMAVILDWVANHTSWDNSWITNKDWYTQDASGNIVHPPGTNWQDVADLNYDNTEMRAAMIDAMKYWVTSANVDGFRCDHADGVPFDFWSDAITTLRQLPGRDLLFFAEGDRKNHFTAGFDLSFGWQFYGELKGVFEGNNSNRVFNAHNNEFKDTPADKQWVRFTSNHDESAWDASPIALFGGVNGALAASVVTIFMGGVPLIYGSQEVGVSHNIPFFSNSTIDWSINPDMKNTYQQIFQFYSNSKVAKVGANTNFPNQDVFSFKKTADGKSLWIVVNCRNLALNYSIPDEFKNTTRTHALNKEKIALQETLALGAFQYYILED